MNATLPKIRAARPDLSDYLFHFTKGRDAKATLTKIVDCGELLDLNNTKVICFTEAPLLLLNDMFTIFERYSKPLYARYGVAVKKDYLFNLGARNVIYGAPNDPEATLDATQWRFEPYVQGVSDYTWLREWRLKSQSFKLNPAQCFLVAPTDKDLDMLIPDWDNVGDVEFEGELDEDGNVYGSKFQRIKRGFKGISFERLTKLNSISGVELDNLLNKQSLGEKIGIHDMGVFVHPRPSPKFLSLESAQKILAYLQTL